jgi:outer membrane protein OmpA-like peptidoglycan-associated protein
MLELNPTVRIELRSHTDSKGADVYNLALSQRRAKAAEAYFMNKGIPPTQLIGIGYGEKEIRNGCTNGVQCSPEQHKENRRIEFLVTDY